MFKSSKKSKQSKKTKAGGGAALMQQMGFQIPNFDDPNFGGIGEDDDEDDDALEAELKLMQNNTGGHASKRSKPNKKKPEGSAQDLHTFHNEVNKLLTDIDRPINDDELSDGDENDLLAELHEITGGIESEQQTEHVVETKPIQSTSNNNVLTLLETRREMYKKALATAQTNGDNSKARRLDRQYKFIQELIKTASTGAPINESEIPPELFVAEPSSSQPKVNAQEIPIQPPSSPQPSSTTTMPKKPISNKTEIVTSVPVTISNNSQEAIAQLKTLALQAREQGDIVKAKEYLIQMKTLQNETIHASTAIASMPKETQDNLTENENSAPLLVPLKANEPRTILEALEQRHEELTKRHKEAAKNGESAKARRLDRLATQYQEAIDATRKGRSYDYSELPDLPGFAPIPVKPQPPPSASSLPTSQPISQLRSTQVEPQRSIPSNGVISQSASKPSINSQKDQQEHYRKLALQAKQKGDIEAAKKYLRASKELEQPTPVIQSDVADIQGPTVQSNIPICQTPEPVEGFDVIRDDELTKELAESDRDTIYHRLQDDLLRQMQLCARNQQIYAQMEGLNNMKYANEFKVLEQRSAQDLDRLRKSFQHGLKPPTFHYEKRQMNIIHVNSDLNDNDFEVTVVRGINLPVPSGYSPSSFETYVVIEFPYPPETPQTARTRHGTGSTNAEYLDSTHKFQIKRNDNKFKRLLNRKDLKLNLFYKVGFLRSDRQLGTASIKLAPLEQVSTIHESVDILENDHKKKIAGKLEVKIRIKEAIGQIKTSQSLIQQWLVIDRFEDIPQNRKPSTTKSQPTTPAISAISKLVPTGESLGLFALNLAVNTNQNDSGGDDRRSSVSFSTNDNNQQQTNPQSIQVLKYEANLLHEQIEQLEDHLTPDQIDRLRTKEKKLKKQSDQIVENLRQGGKQALEDHIRNLRQLIEHYDKEADEFRQRNDTKKADLCVNKKNLVTEEIEKLTGPT